MKRIEYIKSLEIEKLAKVILYGFDCMNCPDFMACSESEEPVNCNKHVVNWLNEEIH